MSIVLQCFLIAFSLAFNVLVLYMVRVGRAEMRYALAWLMVGLIMLLLSIFPNLLSLIALVMNVAIPINAAFFLAILLLMSIMMGITIAISGHKSRIYKLMQLVAIQEKRITDLEAQLKQKGAAAQDAPAIGEPQ